METLSDRLQAARDLHATIWAARKETEDTRRLAPPIVEGLIDAGLCRLVVPLASAQSKVY